jgi:hypothetical protein
MALRDRFITVGRNHGFKECGLAKAFGMIDCVVRLKGQPIS